MCENHALSKLQLLRQNSKEGEFTFICLHFYENFLCIYLFKKLQVPHHSITTINKYLLESIVQIMAFMQFFPGILKILKRKKFIVHGRL